MSTALRWIGFVAGTVIVLGTFSSVLRTLVVPRALPSRLGFGVSRSLWRLVLVLSRRTDDYERKDRILTVGAPLALLVLLATWVTTFIVGFGLMTLPFHDSSVVSALRDSGAALLTLSQAGFGGFAIVIHFVAAATGLATVALLIAYLPTLYAAFNRREMLVTLLESRAGAPAWGPELLARHQLVGINDNLPSLYAEWERWAADVAETHSTYPMLIYFRSPNPLQSWLVGLLAVLDSAAMYLALAPSTAPSEARLCLRMGFTCLRDLADVIGLTYDADPHPEDPIQLTFEEFSEGVDGLRAMGFPMERTAADAWADFKGWRVNYEPLTYALADRIVAVPALWSGPRTDIPVPPIAPDRPAHRAPGKPRPGGRI